MRPLLRRTLTDLWVVVILALTMGQAGADGRTPVPQISRGQGERCVEPVQSMRRDHMRFLQHKRDETVRLGVRTKKYSLKECISCHVKKDAGGKSIPVNAAGQFCASCHAYAAVNIDCFQCHATTPDSGNAGGKISSYPALPRLDGSGGPRLAAWHGEGISVPVAK